MFTGVSVNEEESDPHNVFSSRQFSFLIDVTIFIVCLKTVFSVSVFFKSVWFGERSVVCCCFI